MTEVFQPTLRLLTISALAAISVAVKLETVYEWKYIDYVWNSEDQKQDALNQGQYDYTKIITHDVQELSDGRVLITTPKYFNNPASLSVISDQFGPGGPLLKPYPSWDWHTTDGVCSGITSVGKVQVDDCNRLWLVDSGKIGNDQVCPAKILAFNTDADELLLEFEIPNELSHSPYNESRGLLELQVIETTPDSCDNFWVYISDLEGYGLLIWDGTDIWRLDDETFEPTSEGEKFSIAGEDFILRRGPEGLLITPPGFLEQPYLIYKPLSSVKTFAASIEDLHNSKSGVNITYYMSEFTAPTQEPAKVFSKTGGILFASFISQLAVACWNLQTPLETDNTAIVEQNNDTLQYMSSAKTTEWLGEESGKFWVTSNRLQKFILRTMDFTEINFRVMVGDVMTIVRDTVCEPQNPTVANSIEDKKFYFLKQS